MFKDPLGRKVLIIGGVAFLISIAIFITRIASGPNETIEGLQEVLVADAFIRQIQQDADGEIWFVEQGFASGGTIPYFVKSVSGEELKPFEFISSFLIDRNGRFLISTRNNLHIMEPGGSWTKYAESSAIPFGDISVPRIIGVDRHDRLWVAWEHRVEGVFSFVELNDESMEFSYDLESALPMSEDFRGAFIDKDGDVWAVHQDALKILSDDNEWLAVRNVMADSDCMGCTLTGDIFVSDRSRNCLDIIVMDEDMNEVAYQGPCDASDLRVKDCVFDEQGRIWAISYSDLIMMKPEGGWTIFDRSNTGINDLIEDIFVDSDNKIWFSAHGLYSFNPESTDTGIDPMTNRFIIHGLFPSLPLAIFILTINAYFFIQPGALSKGKVVEYILGFAGFFMFFHLYYAYAYANTGTGDLILYCGLLPLPLLIVSLIVLLVFRLRGTALGLFSAIVLNMIASLLYYPEIAGYPYIFLEFTPFYFLH